MKFGGISPVYNEKALIKGCIKSLENFVDDHYIIVSEEPYFGEAQPDDGTSAVAESLGAHVIKGTWPLDHMQRNVGIALLQDCDWIIVTDVDMWMTKKDMETMIHTLERNESDAYVIPQVSYWRDLDHVLSNDTFRPVIAIRPHVKFSYIGNIDTYFRVLKDCVVHHINWCDPKDIYKKVTTYPHAPEFDGEKWYKENYLTWKEGELARLPTGDLEVAYQPLPEELRRYL